MRGLTPNTRTRTGQALPTTKGSVVQATAFVLGYQLLPLGIIVALTFSDDWPHVLKKSISLAIARQINQSGQTGRMQAFHASGHAKMLLPISKISGKSTLLTGSRVCGADLNSSVNSSDALETTATIS